MWKRILAWQQKAPEAIAKDALARSDVEAAHDQRLAAAMPAFIASKKNDVALQRELAKLMW